jgi:hypothetical protein
MTYMMGNLVNVLQQPLSLAVAALRVRPRYILTGFFRAWNPQTYKDIATMSPGFMADRQQGQLYDSVEHIRQIVTNAGAFTKTKDFLQRHAYFLQTVVQNIMDAMVWSASYQQALDDTAANVSPDEAKRHAVDLADATIRTTMGSFSATDVAGYEGELTPFAKVFFQFSGWFNTMANVQGDQLLLMRRTTGWTAKSGLALQAYVLAFAVPMMLGEALAQALRGQIKDEDDDGSWIDDFGSEIVMFGQLRSMFAEIPGLGALPNTALNFIDDSAWNDRMVVPPSVALLERSIYGTRDLAEVLRDGEKDLKGRTVRDVLTALGFVLRLPGGMVGRTAGYLTDVEQGTTQPANTADLIRGLATGR